MNATAIFYQTEGMRKIIMFGFNYRSDFIETIWSRDPEMVTVLTKIFTEQYGRYSPTEAFHRFYIKLDNNNQSILLKWIAEHYAG